VAREFTGAGVAAVTHEQAFELAKEFLDAYDSDELDALDALQKKYRVRRGESILATLFLCCAGVREWPR
jgi:hypothetical protein